MVRWQRKYTTIRLKKEQWFAKYKEIARQKTHHILLESGRDGKYSIIGMDPLALIYGKDGKLTVEENGKKIKISGSLLSSLKDTLQKYEMETDPNLPPFQGGALGYISYDIARELGQIADIAVDDLQMDDLYFIVFAQFAVYDHEQEQLFLIGFHEDGEELEKEILRYKRKWLEPMLEDKSLQSSPIQKNEVKWADTLNKETFCQAVKSVIAAIKDGYVEQVNLSTRQTKVLNVAPFSVYEALRMLNPSPYMAYMEVPGFQLVSGSPELLIKKSGQRLSARPIGGTRPRGEDAAEDEAYIQELLHSKKDCEEHLMLVEVEQEDIGKVAKRGTVHVNERMVIEKYSHVIHLVSNVEGELIEGKDLYDVIRAKFPGGSITGLPKAETIEMIEQLEPVRRGVYTGSIGWLGFNGDMELNIAIRTIVCKDGFAHVQAGAGITVDSIPEKEYNESLKKAEALWRALDLAEHRVNDRRGD